MQTNAERKKSHEDKEACNLPDRGRGFVVSAGGGGRGECCLCARVYIHEIQYSPAGPDVPVTTAKLDGEWVLLTNTTGKSVTMTRWTLRDTAGHVYRFPSFVLKARKSVVVHTGTGKNSATNLYWGHKPPSSTSYVWNNSGKETATLKSASGKTIDSRSYTGKSVSGAAQVFYKP